MSLDIMTIAKNYLKALKVSKTGNELALFYHEDVVQTEYPNLLNPKGNKSNLRQLLERAEQGKKLLKSQEYTIQSSGVNDATVVFEILWTGILAVPLATLRPGDTVEANFAMFIEFKDGKIISQRNYDCFQPL